MDETDYTIKMQNTIHDLEKRKEFAQDQNNQTLINYINLKIAEAQQALIAETVHLRNNNTQPRAGVKGTTLA